MIANSRLESTPYSHPSPDPLELLVIQPTPFCNINCSYCYLPDRKSTRRMAPETLDQTFRWVFASGLVQQPFTILWHAGEPLVMPISFYQEAFNTLARHNRDNIPILQSFQTNATLINEDWCAFLQGPNLHVGVSVDGPDFLHDRHRKTRQGKGTHDLVLRGIGLLQKQGIPFEVITVLTADSLDYPDELYDFYVQHQIHSVAFNVEEVEGPHTTSSLQATNTPNRFRKFLSRFISLAYSPGSPIRVREFETSATALLANRYGGGSRTQENRPWGIVNVDWEGNFSTYSPELLGMTSPTHGSFALGNVFRNPLEEVLQSSHFLRLESEIRRGVELCQEQCEYFPYCGGGPPGNKYFENHTFASTSTLFCELHKKVCLDVSLSWIEKNRVPNTNPQSINPVTLSTPEPDSE